jgi:hypothetical protein
MPILVLLACVSVFLWVPPFPPLNGNIIILREFFSGCARSFISSAMTEACRMLHLRQKFGFATVERLIKMGQLARCMAFKILRARSTLLDYAWPLISTQPDMSGEEKWKSQWELLVVPVESENAGEPEIIISKASS